MWLVFLGFFVVLALIVFDEWRTDKKLLLLLLTTAKNLGINNLVRVKDLQISWLTNHVILGGSWNHKIATIKTSVLDEALAGKIPHVEPATPWPDPKGAEQYFRSLVKKTNSNK